MAVPVDFLLNNLKQLLMYHVNLISKAKNEFEQLQNELLDLKAILRDAANKRKKDETFRSWESRIRQVVYDVEDIIATRIITMAREEDMNPAERKLSQAKRISLAKLVKSAREDKVRPLLDTDKIGLANLGISDVADTSADETRNIRQQKREDNIVGFDDEATTLIDFLKKESHGLKVLSVFGMPGLGKTTMAWKIFKDPRIEFEFHTRIWVYITEDVDIEKVLLTIQGHFTEARPDMTLEQLTEDVKCHLAKSKFLIVMDDVWSDGTWNRIKPFLPMSNKNGRVLITSREMNVAPHAKQHKLKFLTPQESWQLLQYEVVYGIQEAVDEELKQVGQVIAQRCDGLPLSIIVIGGILADKRSKAQGYIPSIKREWEDVSRSISTYLSHEDKTERLKKIISLSYAKMPYELQGCFLYLGVFPEDAEISAATLILLWIAEGLIQDVPHKSLEDIARDKLNDLIYRNLVMVDKRKFSGEAKVCRVHDTIREFCKKEAAFVNQNLYQEVVYQSGRFEPPLETTNTPCRRICIHSHVYEFLLKKPKVLKAHSFICFPTNVISLDNGDMQCFTDAFGVLRVLHAERIKFPKFPPKLKKLFFLRYLTLSIASDKFKVLPKVIYDLKNLQTFVLDITSRIIEITADFWKMKQMRHFKTKASIILKNGGECDGGENLQTLSRLSPESCTYDVLNKARNLSTLGIQGDLSTLNEFKHLEKLVHLNKLKLVHDVHNASGSERPWRQLPEANEFPSMLKFLVLEGTCLGWEQMTILGRLRHLEVLKLKDNAFQGPHWHASGGGFCHLEYLHIERAELVSWTASSDAFPQLNSIFLKNCDQLLEVPQHLVEKLEKLYMERVTSFAVSSAKKIEKEKQQASGLRKRKRDVFHLEIAPTDNLQ